MDLEILVILKPLGRVTYREVEKGDSHTLFQTSMFRPKIGQNPKILILAQKFNCLFQFGGKVQKWLLVRNCQIEIWDKNQTFGIVRLLSPDGNPIFKRLATEVGTKFLIQ